MSVAGPQVAGPAAGLLNIVLYSVLNLVFY